jgi:hypothetical protein
MQPITVTNNYFADQAAYIKAAGLPKNTKFKKADLYDEIASWNRVCADAAIEEPETYQQELARVQADLNAATFDEIPTNVVEITADNSFDELFANWEQAKTEKTMPKPAAAKAIALEWTKADDFEISKFKETKDRTARALIIHHLRQTHSAKTIALKAGISDRDVARKTNAVNIYHASERMRQIVNMLTPWGRFETAIGIVSASKNSLDDLCDRALKLRTVA